MNFQTISKRELFSYSIGYCTELLKRVKDLVEFPSIVEVPSTNRYYHLGTCGFYVSPDRPLSKRVCEEDLSNKIPTTGVFIMIDKCASQAKVYQPRKCSWMGNISDRTVMGVIAHELGHHVDFALTRKKYLGASHPVWVSARCRTLAQRKTLKSSHSKPLTSYCPNDGEWFAEMFRLYLLNPALLYRVRPTSYTVINDLVGAYHQQWYSVKQAVERLEQFDAPSHIIDRALKKIESEGLPQ